MLDQPIDSGRHIDIDKVARSLHEPSGNFLWRMLGEASTEFRPLPASMPFITQNRVEPSRRPDGATLSRADFIWLI